MTASPQLPLLLPELSRNGATISECGLYRYILWRVWDASRPMCGAVWLNPSAADASHDDPSLRRGIGFARAWGYGGLWLANMYAYRATDPRELLRAFDPVGPGNDSAIETVAHRCAIVVAGWGAGRGALGHPLRIERVRSLIHKHAREIHAYRISKFGTPDHPLYLPGGLRPVVWSTRTEGAR